MLQTVDVGQRSIEAYRGLVSDGVLDELRLVARDLRGARVVHLNATPYGGGVSELLRSEVPLLNDLGLVCDWKIISGDDDFFQVTKKMHNALQGADDGLTIRDQRIYEASAERNAGLLEEEYDFVIVHDPQPAGILSAHGKGDSLWVWRCHIDTSEPNPHVWRFLRDMLGDYDAAVFTMDEFVPPTLPIRRVDVIPPAIDPLSPKNMPLDPDAARQVLDWIGIDVDLPLITQISRFDPWKDPLGVIAAYRLVRDEFPGLQLALVGSMALDDPQGWQIYRDIQRASQDDPMIHLFTNLTGVGNIEVNAFQRMSDVVVQKSIREGFGLVVSEALWKATPTVAGRAGGIPLQLADDLDCLLVDSVQECAQEISALLRDPVRAAQLGSRGRQRVGAHFLLPRLLLNELSLLCGLGQPGSAAVSRVRRDPVCGMALGPDQTAPTTEIDGLRVAFCSVACQSRFLSRPERYASVGGTPLRTADPA
ncbi:glycosyltransferase [Hamadaea sp. NPDC050747]|uniref:glycosyltransferase n=1 Tax=Hamadaea sp. NPDC050747 TaxID=3155789 RepID=UPI0033E8F986